MGPGSGQGGLKACNRGRACSSSLSQGREGKEDTRGEQPLKLAGKARLSVESFGGEAGAAEPAWGESPGEAGSSGSRRLSVKAFSVVHMKSSALDRERPLASEFLLPRALHGASGPDPGASEWHTLAAPFGGAASSGRGRLGPGHILAALGSWGDRGLRGGGWAPCQPGLPLP